MSTRNLPEVKRLIDAVLERLPGEKPEVRIEGKGIYFGDHAILDVSGSDWLWQHFRCINSEWEHQANYKMYPPSPQERNVADQLVRAWWNDLSAAILKEAWEKVG